MRASDLRRRLKRRAGEILGRLRSDDRPRCLVYHDVVQSEELDRGQMTVSVSLLEEHLDLLKTWGYQVVDASWAVQELRGRRALPRRTVILTFDDGLHGARLAQPVLAKRGVSATLFVTSDMAAGRVMAPRPALDWEALRQLFATGAFVPGAHGATHVALDDLDDAALAYETAGARREIAELTGMPCDLFAYPFGSFGTWDGRARSAVERAGYAAAFTSVYGTLGSDLYALPRCRVSWAEDAASFELLLKGAYDWYRWVQLAQAHR